MMLSFPPTASISPVGEYATLWSSLFDVVRCSKGRESPEDFIEDSVGDFGSDLFSTFSGSASFFPQELANSIADAAIILKYCLDIHT